MTLVFDDACCFCGVVLEGPHNNVCWGCWDKYDASFGVWGEPVNGGDNDARQGGWCNSELMTKAAAEAEAARNNAPGINQYWQYSVKRMQEPSPIQPPPRKSVYEWLLELRLENQAIARPGMDTNQDKLVNPPVPAGWKLMKDSEVTGAMTQFAVALLRDMTLIMWDEVIRTFTLAPVPPATTGTSKRILARIEYHPPDFQNHSVHRGVTLYEPV